MSYFKKILLFAFCALPMMLSAQSQSQTYNNELGVDVTSLVGRLMGTGYGGGVYDFTYKKHFEKVTMRFGLGIFSTFSEREEFEIIGSDDQFNLSARVGVEKAFTVTPNWNVFYGFDVRYSLSSSTYEYVYGDGEYQIERNFASNSVGFAPIVGLEYRVNNRISIRTEASAVASFFEIDNTYQVNQLVDDPERSVPNFSDVERRGTSFRFNSPSFLVLTYKF